MKTLREYIDNLAAIEEGIFERFKKKPVATSNLTPEDRELIKKYFPNSNADLRWGGPESEYVLPSNAHSIYGRGRIAFYNKGGQLTAGVAFHQSHRDAASRDAIPVTHYDVPINSEDDMVKLKEKLDD